MLNPPTPESLTIEVKHQLRSWHTKSVTDDAVFRNLFLVRKKLEGKDRQEQSIYRLVYNQVLWDGIKHLKTIEPELGQLLELRFPEDETMKGTALKLNLTANQVKHKQAEAIDIMVDKLLGDEELARQDHINKLLNKLQKPSYKQMVGTEYLHEVVEKLSAENSPNMWAIVGIGGVGKTSLAHYLTRKLLQIIPFENVAWVWIPPESEIEPQVSAATLISHLWQQLIDDDVASTSAPDQLKQLKQYLQHHPSLIVVDNLETEVQLDLVANTLEPLAGSARILLTSRKKPKPAQEIPTHYVSTLPQAAAYQLLRQYGGDDLLGSTDEDLEKIWQLTGGHPLALKLIAGLAATIPLPSILTELIAVETKKVTDFYNSIYHRVYKSLSPNARRLLRVMPLATGDGMPIGQMQAISVLATEALWDAIDELVRSSLLELNGSAWERSYRIHRLTHTFLKTEILGLPGDEEDDDTEDKDDDILL